MNGTLAGVIVMVSALVLNWTSLYVSFPDRRKPGFYIVCVIAASPIAFATSFLISGVTSPIGLNGLVLLPFCIWLLKGHLFQTTFAVILQMLLTISEHALCGVIVRMFVQNQSDKYYLYWVIGSLFLYAVHAIVLLKWGQKFYKKLYALGRDTEWAAYSFSAAFSFLIMVVMYNVLETNVQIILMFLYVFWEFSVLCFSIINTHEKTKQRMDAEFARNMISTGHNHYQQMDEMYDKLRTLRHDYKYHLNATRKMLHSGNAEEAEQYINSVEEKLSQYEMTKYCENAVIDALVADYAERCRALDISFTAKLAIPEALSLPDYDMCIILGNLLENAVEACAKPEHCRKIELAAHMKAARLLLMVKNSFNGTACKEDDTLISLKAEGGFGLRSVREVVNRYDGDLHIDWTGDMFTVYVSV